MITITIADLTNENKKVLRNIAAMINSVAESEGDSLHEMEQISHNENFTKKEIEESKNWAVTPECVETEIKSPAEIKWNEQENMEVKNDPKLLEQAYSNEDIDSEGTRWNPELHSRTKSKNKDGTWRTKRGIQDDAVKTITTQYQPTIPTPPKSSEIPQPPAITFSQFIQKISHALINKEITHAQVADIVETVGLKELNELNNHPELLPLAEMQFDGVIKHA